MPIEVRELVIRANVGAENAAQIRAADEARLAELKKEILAKCAEQTRQQLNAANPKLQR